MTYKYDITVVVPLYNEEESLPELCEWISRVMGSHGFTYEVLLVDDGSNDQSWSVVTEQHELNKNIKGIRFNRNNGKSAALQTGFNAANGEVVITMDADLQDSPDEIPGLYKMIKEDGYDLVSGWKKVRHDPALTKRIPSKIYNSVTGLLSGVRLNDMNCGLKAYKNLVIKTIRVYGEMHRYIPVIAKWNGFIKIGEKVVEHRARKYGVSKFGLSRFVNGFLDLLSITFVSKFKRKPMHFFGTLGSLSFFTGFVFTLYLIGLKLYSIYFSNELLKRDITDRPAFYMALVAVVIGVQLFLTGFIAEMLAMNNHSKNEYLILDQKGLD